ncbi:MAG: squalene--hopene cyclase, partial [Thermoanaerobaculia bacterium]|nr:squalene--hopene cyclase [Thermoanaerobaculia bacterium]
MIQSTQSTREIVSRELDRPSVEAAEPTSLGARLRRAVESAQAALLAQTNPDGHWCGELEGDTILESEYALVLHFLDRGDDPRITALAATLRQKQLPTGGWSLYPEGPADVSASVKAYLVLKLAGDDPERPHMARARRKILELGGVDACNSFTKIYLAICGQWPWSSCPAVVPEMILLPTWLYFNVYAMSSWSRAIVVPLSIVWAHRPCYPLPERAHVPELRLPAGERPEPHATMEGKHPFWSRFFELVNWGLRGADRLGLLAPWRQTALRRAERWILERLEQSDGLAAIFPPIVNTLVAFRCLGYPLDHPTLLAQTRELEKLEIAAGETLRLQPCKSPVWDTALSLSALLGSGLAPRPPGDPRRGALAARQGSSP